MVRTSGGIRISAGKSSKKSGGGSGSHSAPSTSGRTGSKGGSSRLPPIPHCEAPSWQKPITNFFNAGAGSSRNDTDDDDKEIIENISENIKDGTETKDKCNEGEGNILVNKIGDNSIIITEDIDSDPVIKDKVDIEKENKEDPNNINDDEPQIKKQKKDKGKENENINDSK